MVRSRIEQERIYLVRRPDLAPSLIAQELLVSGEDHRHAWHSGFDPIAICRALWRRLAYGSHEGASTIEQQLVRTITGRYERTLERKLKEIVLAFLVCEAFSRKDLPAVYLAIAYYGWHMNGYRQACKRLRIRPDSLALDRAASLVARLKYPEPKIAPDTRRQQIDRRSKHLLNLYRRHANDGTYTHLDPSTVLSRCFAADLTQSVSEL
jgi:membrane peptidoglycan carboxypeptidase